jgi:phage tail sheath protein FI
MALPPEGYVCAKRALAHNTVGAWQSYAGVISEARFVRNLDTFVDKQIGNFLDDGRVNALRVIPNRVRVYGARTASPDEENWRFLNGQEMLNYVVVEAQRVLEDIVFSPIDGRGTIFSAIKSRLVSLMEPLRIAGGLYEAFDEFGERIDYGYTVVCDESINPVEQLAEGLVRAKIGLRVSSVGDKIFVEVTKSTLTASVT